MPSARLLLYRMHAPVSSDTYIHVRPALQLFWTIPVGCVYVWFGTIVRLEGSLLTTEPLLPPFTRDTAIAKIRGAEDAWNCQVPENIALAYTPDSWWRNRSTFVQGRDQIIEFLKQKWARELNYRLIKELWAFAENRIAVRYCYESQSTAGQWYRSYGNENWEFDERGLMRYRHSSINDEEIGDSERKFLWNVQTPRPEDHPGLSELGL